MATKRDLEDDRNGSLSEPFVDRKRVEAAEEQCSSDDGGAWMVYLSTFISACGSFQFGFCAGYSSPAQFGIMEDLDQTSSEYSTFGSLLTIGAIIGALTCGHTADFAGRKGAMRIASIVCIAGWVAIYISSGALLLDFGRILTGYGIGNLSYVVMVYVAEIAPKELRGLLATLNQLLLVTGLAAAYVIGAYVSWRTLALIGIVPCILLFVGLFFIPESPRWLAMVGRQREFEAALSKLRGPGANISSEQAEIEDSLAIMRQLPKITIPDLLGGRNLRLISTGVILMAFQQLVGINGINYYAAEIFVSAGVAPSTGSILYSCSQVVVTIFGATLMDRAGRRPLLMGSICGVFLGNLLIGSSFLLKERQLAPDYILCLQWVVPWFTLPPSRWGWVRFLGFLCQREDIGLDVSPYYQSVSVAILQLFPLNIKGIGGGLVTLTNWIGSWVISYTFICLFSWSSSGIFYLYGSMCVLAMIFTIKFVPETKGRTLEEIHLLMD
ncbi:hypothetical protein JRO89_XS04G0183600 [Xanthoceras sorbifolium]|uniref:Major facilitator superfamily (MFS) profile domain-containing protein n=1 Tax=Xanthoceras sorbifolium TaxID=99658 RepID=A0ABQ8I5W0_9ROSI|nr:hypothetical protein JRO89_XS04G0183600 [Xanthoceras sorbifolium]